MHTILSSPIILLLSFLQVQKAILATFDEATETATFTTTAHFGDSKRGRMSWIIDESALPWTGQYYFIESTQSPMSNLLIVVDSSNGNHLGNCASFGPRDNKWRRFFWTLTEESLICNITDSETKVSKIHFPSSILPRTFSLRILAQQGPKCFRDMIVQNEKMEGCPPSLKRNFFQGMSLECNCPLPTIESSSSIISDKQSVLKSHIRSNIAPFHFVNPRITSSDGSLPISHDLSLSIPKNTSNSRLFEIVTKIMPQTTVATLITPITATNTDRTSAAITDNATAPGTTTKMINPFDDNHGNSESLASIVEELLITTYDPLSSSLSPQAQACASIQCQNNGTCSIRNDGTAICMCPEGFFGTQCEINLCSNVRCLHGGICRITGNVPYCQCRSGTTGTFCEEIICNPKCEQGGICELTGGAPVCRCPTGTFGINCNIIDTCINNDEICTEYDNDARCQLDSDNFALISPVPVNATFKCLCLNERSEWTNCKELPRKTLIPLPTTTTMNSTHPALATSGLLLETSEEIRPTHGVPLLQNHPHFSNLFPNPFIMPSVMSTTTVASSFINSDSSIHQHDQSAVEISSSLNRSTSLLSESMPTVPAQSVPSSFDSVDRISNFSTAVAPPLMTPKSPFRLHHLFNMTPEFAESSKPEITTITSIALPGQSESMDFTSSISPIHATNSPAGKISGQLSENSTVTPLTILSGEEFPTSPSVPKVNASNTSTTPSASFLESITVMPDVLVLTTGVIDRNGMLQIDHFTSNVSKEQESTLFAISPSHTDHSMSSTTSFIPPLNNQETEDEGWDWLHSFTKPAEETEWTTTTDVNDFTAELGQTLTFDEDEVKFVKLTVGLPTTTETPEFSHRSDGAISNSEDTARGDASSWTIALTIIFAFLVLASACITLVLRYIRRSRKLHGKYNPAREESVLSSSYSMPMATVTKEERLI